MRPAEAHSQGVVGGMFRAFSSEPVAFSGSTGVLPGTGDSSPRRWRLSQLPVLDIPTPARSNVPRAVSPGPAPIAEQVHGRARAPVRATVARSIAALEMSREMEGVPGARASSEVPMSSREEAALSRPSPPGGLQKLAGGLLRQCRALLPVRSTGPPQRQSEGSWQRTRSCLPWSDSSYGDSAADVDGSLAEGPDNADVPPCEDAESELARKLYQAAADGRLRHASALIKRGARPDHCTQWGWSPLLRAVLNGNLAMVELLIMAAADCNERKVAGRSPLEVCVLRHHIHLIEPLLKARASPAAHDYAAVRLALEKSNLAALQAFGGREACQVYREDRRRLTAMERQMKREEPLKGEGQSKGPYTVDDGREGADALCCVVCFEAPRTVLLRPCLHLALCSGCARQFQNCPICRRMVLDRIRIFLS